MNFPQLRELETSRTMVDVFKGYNHNHRIGEGWDTSNVVNMANMFNKCLSLIEVDVAE